ncbi:MAG TPA: peptidoglycan-binding domain-containing protein [Actinoplanes sp.]
MKFDRSSRKRATALATMLVATSGVAVFTGGAAQAAPPTCTRSATVGGQTNPIRVPVSSGGSTTCQLTVGNSGAGVRALQDALLSCYNQRIEIDGDFGNATKAALRTAQTRIGVTSDGIYGPNTSARLKFMSLLNCYTIAQATAN